MDEGSLEAAIEAYSAQLQQVECALGAGLDSAERSDLLKLQDDLRQLIELTESSLVSVKKSHLLATLEGVNLYPPVATETRKGAEEGRGLDSEFASFYSEVAGLSGDSEAAGQNAEEEEEGEEEEEEEEDDDDDDDDEDEEEEISGTKVRAPYRTTWGTLEYHNAMVVGTEDSGGAEARVRVLYVHPTHKALKPCPFFLEDKCRFMDNCRFSHGEVVSVSELREFLEADLSHLQEGSSCLARHDDGIWYPAKITEIDNVFYTVKFDSLLLKEVVVEADGIIPPMREDDLPSSDSENDDIGEGEAYAKVFDATNEDWAPSCNSAFGGWEAHTRGIGSKLMLKMGYEFGKGLGKALEGRVEPVHAVVLPKGKSLDQCSELTQRKTRGAVAKDGPASGRRKAKKKLTVTPGGRRNVFDFLNAKLGNAAGPAPPPSSSSSSSSSRRGESVYRGGESTKRSLNVRFFQAAERVAQTEREIKSLRESLGRRNGRDPAMINRLEEKLSTAQKLLVQQKAQEQCIQQDQRKADTHKKMTEF